jgi:hypothetical protein
MKKAIFAVAAAATIAAGTMSAPTTADAGCYGCAVGAGVLGGVVAGSIIGGAIANSQPRYYAPEPSYYGIPRLCRPLSGRLPRRLLEPPADCLQCLRQPGPLEPPAVHLPLGFT